MDRRPRYELWEILKFKKKCVKTIFLSSENPENFGFTEAKHHRVEMEESPRNSAFMQKRRNYMRSKICDRNRKRSSRVKAFPVTIPRLTILYAVNSRPRHSLFY